MEVLTTLIFRRIRSVRTVIPPLTLLVLAACGGGGNGSNPGVPPSPTATATPTPNPNPTASGDTFAYTGSLTQTFTLYGTPAPATPTPSSGGPGPVGSPSPAPSPMATATPWISTSSQTVTQNVSVSTGQSFAGQSGLTELKTQENDAGELETTSVTSQTYLSYAKDSLRANGVDVTEIGNASTDSNGVSLQSAIGSGNGVLEKLPSIPNAQWNNSASRTDTEKDADGQTITTTYAADGTYQQQTTNPTTNVGGAARMISDGSGGDSVSLGISVSGNDGKPNSTITVAAPVGGNIAIGYAIYGYANPTAGLMNLPVWYPPMFPSFASDTYVDEGSTTLPSSCNAGPAYQSVSVEKIVETKKRLDTIFGEYETDQTTQYASPSYGLLCVVLNDDLKNYYDFSGQNVEIYALAFWSTPLRETAVTETLALQSAHLASASANRRVAQGILPQILPQPSLARARLILKAAHAQNVRTLYVRAHSASAKREPR